MADVFPALGTIGVTATYGNWYDRFIGAGIRYVTATKGKSTRLVPSKVNHAVVYVGPVEGYDKPQLVQAAPRGANFADWDSYGTDMIWLTEVGTLNLDDSLTHLSLRTIDRLAIVSAAKDCAIKKIGYNFLDFIAIAFAQKRFGSEISYTNPPWWVKRLSRNDRMICSQLDDYCWAQGSQQLFGDKRPYGLVSPEDLYELRLDWHNG